jgi:hypothetical protein
VWLTVGVGVGDLLCVGVGDGECVSEGVGVGDLLCVGVSDGVGVGLTVVQVGVGRGCGW